MVRLHHDDYLRGRPGFEELKRKTLELCEFLVDVVKVRRIEGRFPHKVGLHQSCHGLRELRLGSSSERVGPAYSKTRQLLEMIEGLQITTPARPDECCGFGGTFAVNEEAVSCMMGQDRLLDHEQAGTEVLTANDMDQRWTTYPDCRRQFAAVLASIGGRCLFVKDLSQLNQALVDLPPYAVAKQVVSLVPGAGRPTVDLDAVADPHHLADVDVAILPGQFGVAENAAVWVTSEGVRHPAVYFLVQHLVLVVPTGEILDNMHQAYQRLRFPGAGFGVFISDPSKTADSEHSLVIGAHGPRSLTVFCLGPPEAPGATTPAEIPRGGQEMAR
jgi:hypothetical protein